MKTSHAEPLSRSEAHSNADRTVTFISVETAKQLAIPTGKSREGEKRAISLHTISATD